MEGKRMKELSEAYEAAQHAHACLLKAHGDLKSAGNWGVYDIIGGGLPATLIKRMRMRTAREHMDEAGAAMRRLQRELQDVNLTGELDEALDGFLGFADLFMDGLFADMMVQRKIRDAEERVNRALEKVEHVRGLLRAEMDRG